MEGHVEWNRVFWNADADAYQAAHGDGFVAEPVAWGVWRVPESAVGALGDVCGLDVLELGCGAADWSWALAAAGARACGLDISTAQLRHAARGGGAPAGVPLVCADAESLPFRDASFDVVLSDHGAMAFCDPDHTLSEVSRVLRPGGLLAFCHGTSLLALTYDRRRDRQTRRLQHRFRARRLDSYEEGTVEVQLSTGEWIRAFTRAGLVVEDLVELCAPRRATSTFSHPPRRWARRWPAEQVWKVRKRA